MYCLKNDIKNLNWDNEEWLINQIILELTPPVNTKYIFSFESIKDSLMNINPSHIIPFYDGQQKQLLNERINIINFYQKSLGFKQNFFSHVNNDVNYRISENDAHIIATNIIKFAIKLNLVKND
jgi:hypothetical protein